MWASVQCMGDLKFINARHQQRTEEAKRRRLSFCAAYAYLLRARVRAGQDLSGIQMLAAKAAGVGKDSWSDHAAYQTQRSVSTRLLKEPAVQQELQRLGLVYDEQKQVWHDPKLQRTR